MLLSFRPLFATAAESIAACSGVIFASCCPNAVCDRLPLSERSSVLPIVEPQTDSGTCNAGGLQKSGALPVYGDWKPNSFASSAICPAPSLSTASAANAVLHDLASANSSVAVVPLAHASPSKFCTHDDAASAGQALVFFGWNGQ